MRGPYIQVTCTHLLVKWKAHMKSYFCQTTLLLLQSMKQWSHKCLKSEKKIECVCAVVLQTFVFNLQITRGY